MRVRPLVLAVAGTLTALTLTACGSSGSSGSASHQMTDGSMMPGHSMTSTQPPTTVSGSPTGDAPAGNAADIAFAQSMIPHHQQAIEMADLALAADAGASKQVTGLAEQIKAAQDPEIEQMTQWLTAWGAPTAMPSGDMAGMDHGDMDMSGMMSNEDMVALGAARGEEFDRMWLQMMIVHHQGAIAMAQQVLTSTANPDVEALAQAVIHGQTAEIDQMKGMLAS